MAIPRQRITLPPGCWRRAASGLVRGDAWEGDDIARFEQAFADLIGVEEAVAVASGRAGLRSILEALELEPGAEVLCASFGYPVVPFVVKSMGFDLRFVDCEMRTLGMDPEALTRTISDRTAAVVATHLYGMPCRIDEIAEIALTHDAHLIEDCAHCGGASVDGKQAGSFGSAAYFSFETSKMINTMGGGMVTAGADVAGRLRELVRSAERRSVRWLAQRLARTTFEATITSSIPFTLGVYPVLRLTSGRGDEDRFASGYHGDHVTLSGRTGRYTNYQAKLGLAQFDGLELRLARRRANAERLIERLRDCVSFQEPARTGAVANYMLVAALFPRRAEVGAALLRRGVDTKHHYIRDCSAMVKGGEACPNAARAEAEVLHLPAHPELSERRIDRIATTVRSVVDTLGAGSSRADNRAMARQPG